PVFGGCEVLKGQLTTRRVDRPRARTAPEHAPHHRRHASRTARPHTRGARPPRAPGHTPAMPGRLARPITRRTTVATRPRCPALRRVRTSTHTYLIDS